MQKFLGLKSGADEAGPDVNDDDIIGIKTMNGKMFRITRQQSQRFGTINNLLQDFSADDYIFLPNVSSLEFATMLDDRSDDEKFFALLRAATYLDNDAQINMSIKRIQHFFKTKEDLEKYGKEFKSYLKTAYIINFNNKDISQVTFTLHDRTMYLSDWFHLRPIVDFVGELQWMYGYLKGPKFSLFMLCLRSDMEDERAFKILLNDPQTTSEALNETLVYLADLRPSAVTGERARHYVRLMLDRPRDGKLTFDPNPLEYLVWQQKPDLEMMRMLLEDGRSDINFDIEGLENEEVLEMLNFYKKQRRRPGQKKIKN